MNEIALVPGGKKEFMDWVNASSKTNHWMYSYNDYECYKNMLGDENLKYMVAKTKSGKFVGCCICFVFPDHAFVAVYYVCPEFRGKGIGTRLFSSVVNDDVRKKNVGLHASPAAVDTYQEKLGFNVKMPWLAHKVKINNVDFSKLSELEGNFSVKDIKEVSLEQLVEYDTKIVKTNRKLFVRFWTYERPDAVSKVVLNSNNEIIGYGSAHMLSVWDTPVFCPVYGDNDHVFGAIFCALTNHFKKQIQHKNAVDLRVPTGNLEAVKKVLEGIGDIEAPEADTPLFTKSVPEHDIDKIYSITALTVFI